MLQVQFYRSGTLYAERLMHHAPQMGSTVTLDQQHKFTVTEVDWQGQAPDPYYDRDVIHVHLAPKSPA